MPFVLSESKPFERKRAARAVLTGMCHSLGSVMRQGNSFLPRLTGHAGYRLRYQLLRYPPCVLGQLYRG